MRDYFDDFKVILHVSAFRKVVELVLENCIVVILGRTCVSPYTLGKTFTKFSDVACDVFEEDIQSITSFFKTFVARHLRLQDVYHPQRFVTPRAATYRLQAVWTEQLFRSRTRPSVSQCNFVTLCPGTPWSSCVPSQ